MKYLGKKLVSVKYSELLQWAFYTGLSVFELCDSFDKDYPGLDIIDDSVDGILQGRSRKH